MDGHERDCARKVLPRNASHRKHFDKFWDRAGTILGGGRGIRTLDTVSRIHAFQACAFSRSATPPAPAGCRIRAHYSQGSEADNSPSPRARRKSPALGDDPGIKQATRRQNAAARQTMRMALREPRAQPALARRSPGLAVAIDSWCPCASGLCEGRSAATLRGFVRRGGIGAAGRVV